MNQERQIEEGVNARGKKRFGNWEEEFEYLKRMSVMEDLSVAQLDSLEKNLDQIENQIKFTEKKIKDL